MSKLAARICARGFDALDGVARATAARPRPASAPFMGMPAYPPAQANCIIMLMCRKHWHT